MKTALTLLLSILLSALTFSSTSVAEEEEELNLNPLTASAKLVPHQVRPGEQTSISIEMFLAKGYHAYLGQFKLKWAGAGSVEIGKLEISPVEKFEDTFSGKIKEGIKKKAVLKTIIEVSEKMPLGDSKAKFLLRYQACTKQHCLFPKNIPVEFNWSVISATASVTEKTSNDGFLSKINKAASGEIKFSDIAGAGDGLLFTLIVIFLAGFLTSLTPCVYPMIPITLAVIGAKSSNTARAKSFSLSVVYVLGIAFTFSVLGVFAALTGSLFGSTQSHPVVAYGLAFVFVLLGLSMYGFFELQAPAFLRNSVSHSKGSGYFGAFFTGLVSGIVAGPCVGPVLFGVLAHVGEKQDPFYGFILLFTYSIGMGMIFLALGTFSGLANRIPRAGKWMDLTKFIFGTTMIGMALFYIQPFAEESSFHIYLGVAIVLISSIYGAFKSDLKDTSDYLQKGLMFMALILGSLLVARGVAAKFDLLPKTIVSSTKKKNSLWVPYSDKLIAQAKAEGKPVIIDFWAEWCAACIELEELTFPTPEVMKHSPDFVLLKFDATSDSDALGIMREKYEILGLPTIVFIDKSGQWRKDLTLTGFEDGPSFATRMKKVLN